MKYDFDEIVERRGTQSLKYDTETKLWGRDDLLPLWVADMDFRTPPFIMEAINAKMQQGILGYTVPDEKYFMRLFKKQEGMTPSQYRAAFQKKYINAK